MTDTTLANSWPEVDGGLAISGIFDLDPIRRTGLDDVLRLSAEDVETLSPIRHVSESARPLIVAYGARELPELQRQSRDYHAARRRAGCPGDLMALVGEDHFSILDGLIAPDGALARAAAALARG